MSDTLMVIRPPSSLRKEWEWMTLATDAERAIHTLSAEIPLYSLTSQPGAKNIHLLLPPEGFLHRSLQLPNARYKLTPQTLQWLAEETLPENASRWHWTVIEKRDAIAEVIGIQAERLTNYLAPLRAAGLNVTSVLPDGCYLPYQPESWTLVHQQENWLVRTAEHAFNELDANWLRHLAAQFTPDNLFCHGELPADFRTASKISQYPETPALTLYTPDTQTERYNLMHGEFYEQKKANKANKWLSRLALASIALVVLSFVVGRGVALWQALQIEEQLQQQQLAIWQSYFPHIKRTNNFRFYFKQQAAQQYSAAVPLFHHLQTILQEHPNLHLIGATYSLSQRSLLLKMTAPNEASIDNFCETMQAWLPMEKTGKSNVDGIWTLRNQKND